MAARPQVAVKKAAWQQVIEDDTLANITTRSIVGGFVQPGQADVLAPFRTCTSAPSPECGSAGRVRSPRPWSIGLYPSWDISQGGLDAADAFLADPDVPPSLRRLVLEGRAGVERALRGRAFDVT